MNHYYDAYDKRYKIIHEKGHSWSSDIPTPIGSDVIQKHSISKNASILEIGCGEGRDAFHLMLWLASIVRRLKQKSVHVLRNKRAEFLTDCFRKEHTFRSECCFVCSIGEAILILYANILKIRVNGIHPID